MERIPRMETARTATVTAPTEPMATGPTATARTEPTGTARTAEPSGLAALIGAAAAASLREQALGRAAFRTRIAPERAASLFGWPRLNAALAEHRLTPPRLRVEQLGADMSRAVFRARRTRRGALHQDLDP